MATITSSSMTEKAALRPPQERFLAGESGRGKGIKDILNIIKSTFSIKTSENYVKYRWIEF
jgi:hypothetical protein